VQKSLVGASLLRENLVDTDPPADFIFRL